jgi:hypothetical protein
LKDRLDAAIEAYPDTAAVLVRRHGIYGNSLFELSDCSLGKHVGAMQMHYGMYRLFMFSGGRNEEARTQSRCLNLDR